MLVQSEVDAVEDRLSEEEVTAGTASQNGMPTHQRAVPWRSRTQACEKSAARWRME